MRRPCNRSTKSKSRHNPLRLWGPSLRRQQCRKDNESRTWPDSVFFNLSGALGPPHRLRKGAEWPGVKGPSEENRRHPCPGFHSATWSLDPWSLLAHAFTPLHRSIPPFCTTSYTPTQCQLTHPESAVPSQLETPPRKINASSLRVLHLLAGSDPGGVSRYVHDMAVALRLRR